MKSCSIRIDEKMLAKLRYIAKYEYRSVNKMAMIILREYIDIFEKKHGEIRIEEEME